MHSVAAGVEAVKQEPESVPGVQSFVRVMVISAIWKHPRTMSCGEQKSWTKTARFKKNFLPIQKQRYFC